MEVAILNGIVVSPRGIMRSDVGIDQGRIIFLAEPGSLPIAERTIDAAGLLVLPGIIDSHFHCRAPANPEREDFASGTRAAAASGVTTVLEMPISVPPTMDGESLAIRRTHAERDAYVNVGFYSSSASLDSEKIRSSVEEGAVAFKSFLQDVPVGREDEFTGICIYRNGDIMRALTLAKESGLPSVFHAEDFDTLSYLEQQLRGQGRNDIAAHWEWRPDYVEAISVNTLCLMAEGLGVHVHLPHISSGLSVEFIRAAKQRGAPVTAETCPQYLLFDRETLKQHGPYAKCNPPFKTQADIAALWDGLRDGTIDTVATDHSPFTVDEKEVGWDNIWKAPPGFPGVEVLTPFIMTAGLNGDLELEHAVSLVTTNPANIFGLASKGQILPGADADITIYDPEGHSKVDTSTWHSRSKDIARVWDGLEVTGKVVMTLLKGQSIFENGEIVGSPGLGSILRPSALSRASSLQPISEATV